MLSALSSESVPEYLLFDRDHRLTSDALTPFLGEKVVLKVVSPDVVHKSDVGGVKVVSRLAGKISSESRRMMDTVSRKYAEFIETNRDQEPSVYQGLSGEELRDAVSKRIRGVLITQYLPPESDALGNELLVSLRWTREFGMVVTAGLGGTDTELYAERFRLGQAVVSASTAHATGEEFFEIFCKTITYEKLSGQTRGAKRLVSDEQLMECFGAFIEVGNYYSPLHDGAPYVIVELEVNPFALVDYEMVPLDGLCRFALPLKTRVSRGIQRMGKMLHPDHVAIIGVSATKMNFGRNILENMLKAGRTAEGKNATAGHTASVAGDYMVCTSCLSQAGALVADSLEEFDGLMNLASTLHTKTVTGYRVGALTPAGFESVGIADSLEARDLGIQIPEFRDETNRFSLVVFNDAGDAHEQINDWLRQQGVPVFSSCSQAMTLLARYTAYRFRLNVRGPEGHDRTSGRSA